MLFCYVIKMWQMSLFIRHNCGKQKILLNIVALMYWLQYSVLQFIGFKVTILFQAESASSGDSKGSSAYSSQKSFKPELLRSILEQHPLTSRDLTKLEEARRPPKFTTRYMIFLLLKQWFSTLEAWRLIYTFRFSIFN
jgi:hypothetical protein